MNNFKTWNADNLQGLLNLLVGQSYGLDVVAELDTIKKTKYYEAQNIISRLNLKPTDTVIDLGSGCGFIADHIAPVVQQVNCVDISESFMQYNRLVNQHHSNVDFYLIPFGDMSVVPKATAIYSVAVFIHFTLYDCYLYLQQCYKCLEEHGTVWFDILNDQKLDIADKRWQRHTARYIKDRTATFTNIHYNNVIAICNIATQLGFKVEQTYDENDHTFFLLRKS